MSAEVEKAGRQEGEIIHPRRRLLTSILRLTWPVLETRYAAEL